MDISHAVENGRSTRPVRGDGPNPNHTKGQSRSMSSGGHNIVSRDGQRTIQIEDVHEHNKILRHQIQVSQQVIVRHCLAGFYACDLED